MKRIARLLFIIGLVLLSIGLGTAAWQSVVEIDSRGTSLRDRCRCGRVPRYVGTPCWHCEVPQRNEKERALGGMNALRQQPSEKGQ